jgi:acetoacetate decarboxylase
MGFVKTRKELDDYYKLGVRKFIGAEMLSVLFETKPEIVSRLLPPPLTPADVPTGLIFIAHYPKTNLGPGYKEAGLFLNCKYQDEKGNYCLSMPIDSEESRLYNGRDIFGYPKKMAEIHLEKNAGEVYGWIERRGIRFVEIKAKLTDSFPELPEMGVNFLFKASPRIDLKPGFDGPVLLCRQKSDVNMKSLEIGSANLSLKKSVADPWVELEDPKVTLAFYLVSDNTLLPGSVITEVDPDAYLPYYFKITDFFSGK